MLSVKNCAGAAGMSAGYSCNMEWKFVSKWDSTYNAVGAVAVMNNYQYIRLSGSLQRLYQSTVIWELANVVRASAYGGYVYAFCKEDHKIYQIKDRSGEVLTTAYDVTVDLVKKYHHADFDSIEDVDKLQDFVVIDDNRFGFVLKDASNAIILKVYSKGSGEALTLNCSITTPFTHSVPDNRLYFTYDYIYYRYGSESLKQYAYNGQLVSELNLSGTLWAVDRKGNIYYIATYYLNSNYKSIYAIVSYIRLYDSKGKLIKQHQLVGYSTTTGIKTLQLEEGFLAYRNSSGDFSQSMILFDKNLNYTLLGLFTSSDYMPFPKCYYKDRVILYKYGKGYNDDSYVQQTVCLKLK